MKLRRCIKGILIRLHPSTGKNVKIWAHRGCSMQYPENTLQAFEAAAKLSGLTGIELDIHLSLDGEIVVIHDETLDRTTSAGGNVMDYTAEELGRLGVPTMREVFDLLKPYCIRNGLLINIELKNNKNRYEGMEKKIVDLAKEYGLSDYVIYSSFRPESMGMIKDIEPKAQTGILKYNIRDCYKYAGKYNADALHPCNKGLSLKKEFRGKLSGMTVRVWNTDEPFYGQNRKYRHLHLEKCAWLGATDIITNNPEEYLGRMK